mmetsp:Transcript_1802/g.4390  ORF Transcript_1802/g.4390 Transcript_1802/m.4390 type:complete len:1064 (-) Transcript_1802:12-3203(-)
MAAAHDVSVVSMSMNYEEFDAGDSESMLSSMIGELLWFVVGYCIIRILIHLGFMRGINLGFPNLGNRDAASSKRRCAVKALCAAASAGQHSEVVEAWDREKDTPLPLDALTDSAQALAQVAPERLVSELSVHLAHNGAAHPQPATMNTLLEIVMQFGRPDLAEDLASAIQKKLRVVPNSKTREILISGFAAAGNEDKVQELEEKEEEGAKNAAVRSGALAIRGFLRGGNLDAALQRMVSMKSRSLDVPAKAITELFKVAGKLGPNRVREAFDSLVDHVQLPTESFAILLSHCLEREDIELAQRLDSLVCEQQSRLPFGIYEPLLKLYAKTGNPRALVLFDRMQHEGIAISEGLCGNLLARCGESKNFPFVDAIVAYLRGKSMMTLAIFKTLMKLYAGCGQYDHACDIYEQVLAEGLEPDHVMYGCLTKFALKCGRTKLSQEVFSKCKGSDIQSYMCMIRSAGQDGDADRAIELLRRLEVSREQGLDIAVYNCALDACVMNGRMDLACPLLSEVSSKGFANIVTYNTLIKGYVAKGELARARHVFREMEAAGMQPDSASYNCLMGFMATAGSLAQALEVVAEMDLKGVPVDCYTVSIMMKVAKKARNPRDASRALAVLDRVSGAEVCNDEVLFNTVLDACCARQDSQRMSKVLSAYKASSMKPSVHAYGLLIKAYSTLKQPARCQALWVEMVGARKITPTSVTLSCMLDALICARQVESAVSLLDEWKAKVPANTVMYSTLIKGFAAVGDADRATDMHRAMQADGLEMNLVAYTALIDAHARAGKMDEATRLLAQMQAEGCEPNIITFSSLVRGHCAAGQVDEAYQVFSSMSGRGLQPDVVMFNTLLDGCVRHSHFKLADELLALMTKLAVQPSNFTLSIVVKMWGKRRQLGKAIDVVYASMQDASCRLDAHVCTCLMSACLHNNAPDRALDLLAEMKGWRGCEGPDAGTYSALISGLARRGDCRRAVEVAKQACLARLARPLSEESLALLFGALQRRGLGAEAGEALAEQLRAAGMEVPNAVLPAAAAARADAPRGGERSPAAAAGAAKQRPRARRAAAPAMA